MLHTLPSGLRVVLDPLPRSPVTALYLWVDAGSAEERSDERGAAHFVEHMVFKGTRSRNARELSIDTEDVGASLNA